MDSFRGQYVFLQKVISNLVQYKHPSLHKNSSFPLRISSEKCDQFRGFFLRIWLHLLKKSLTENFNFRAMPQAILTHYCPVFFFYTP